MRHATITNSGLDSYRGYFFAEESIEVLGKYKNHTLGSETGALILYLVVKHDSLNGKYSAYFEDHCDDIAQGEAIWECYDGHYELVHYWNNDKNQYLWLHPDELTFLPIQNKQAKFILEKLED